MTAETDTDLLNADEPGHSSPRLVGVSAPDRVLDAWRALLVARESIIRQLEDELAEVDALGLEEIDVLLPLANAADGQLRMSDLAERSLVSRSGLTRRVDRLERRGLVERLSCPSDRRGAWATITVTGRAELDRSLPHHRAVLERRLGARLTPDQLRVLTETLALLGDHGLGSSCTVTSGAPDAH